MSTSQGVALGFLVLPFQGIGAGGRLRPSRMRLSIQHSVLEKSSPPPISAVTIRIRMPALASGFGSNAALDLGRQRGRREILSLDAVGPGERESLSVLAAHPVSAGLERADLRQALNRALALLPEAQRRTFVLHAEAELSYREVAEVLG